MEKEINLNKAVNRALGFVDAPSYKETVKRVEAFVKLSKQLVDKRYCK